MELMFPTRFDVWVLQGESKFTSIATGQVETEVVWLPIFSGIRVVLGVVAFLFYFLILVLPLCIYNLYLGNVSTSMQGMHPVIKAKEKSNQKGPQFYSNSFYPTSVVPQLPELHINS